MKQKEKVKKPLFIEYCAPIKQVYNSCSVPNITDNVNHIEDNSKHKPIPKIMRIRAPIYVLIEKYLKKYQNISIIYSDIDYM